MSNWTLSAMAAGRGLLVLCGMIPHSCVTLAMWWLESDRTRQRQGESVATSPTPRSSLTQHGQHGANRSWLLRKSVSASSIRVAITFDALLFSGDPKAKTVCVGWPARRFARSDVEHEKRNCQRDFESLDKIDSVRHGKPIVNCGGICGP